jgi:hypothetical protein
MRRGVSDLPRTAPLSIDTWQGHDGGAAADSADGTSHSFRSAVIGAAQALNAAAMAWLKELAGAWK